MMMRIGKRPIITIVGRIWEVKTSPTTILSKQPHIITVTPITKALWLWLTIWVAAWGWAEVVLLETTGFQVSRSPRTSRIRV